jgi:hypothetical protein
LLVFADGACVSTELFEFVKGLTFSKFLIAVEYNVLPITHANKG